MQELIKRIELLEKNVLSKIDECIHTLKQCQQPKNDFIEIELEPRGKKDNVRKT